MRVEFIGSFLAFGLAMILRSVLPLNLWAAATIAVIAVLIGFFQAPQFTPFLAGVALAAFLPNRRDVLPAWMSIIGLVLAVYLFGYSGDPIGVFHPVAIVFRGYAAADVWTISALLLIGTIELSGAVVRAPFSGPLATWLGWISFPVYLVQIPVLCAVGCGIFLMAHKWNFSPQKCSALAFFITVGAALIASLPVAAFSDWWVSLVNRATNAVLATRSNDYFQHSPLGIGLIASSAKQTAGDLQRALSQFGLLEQARGAAPADRRRMMQARENPRPSAKG
jgi:peptidoglycan/LPS O-acetylase OafA/YrhL